MFNEKYNPKDIKVLFEHIEDPRPELRVTYPLREIIFLSIIANMCGVESWHGMEIFGETRIDFLRKFFPYSSGIPSRHTISRIFSIVKPAFFEGLISQVIRLFQQPQLREMIAIDGKTVCGSSKMIESKLHLLNAVSIDRGLALSQIACDNKSNEITAIPEILQTLETEGAIITIDAMGCQKSIAQKIRQHGADFVLAVKNNQKSLYEDISSYFEATGFTYDKPEYYLETVDKAHGRLEKRCYQVVHAPRTQVLSSWKGVHSIAMVSSEVTRKGLTTSQVRFYISSLSPDPKEISRAIRGHWAIENQLHWTLDVIFGEDADLKRKDFAPRNFAVIRKLSLNFIRMFLGKTTGVKDARMMAALDPMYMESMLKSLFLTISH